MPVLKTRVYDSEVHRCFVDADVHYDVVGLSDEHDGLIEFVKIECNGVEIFPSNEEYTRIASIVLFKLSEAGCTI